MTHEVDGRRRGVLITRPAAEGAETAARVEALGFVPVMAPLLVVRVMPIRVAPADAALVTSGNALAALAGWAGPVFTVGDATAERARAAGLGPVHSAGGDAGDLVALVRQACPAGLRLLLASGRGQGVALASELRGHGFRVLRRTAYVARPAARLPDAARLALYAGTVRAALFLSADTARTFRRVLPAGLHAALGGVEALAIGAAAAEALALLPFRRVRVSLAPTLDQVLTLL